MVFCMAARGHRHPEVEIIIPVLPRSLKVKLKMLNSICILCSEFVYNCRASWLQCPCWFHPDNGLHVATAKGLLPAFIVLSLSAPSDTRFHSIFWKYGFQSPCLMDFFLLLQPFLSSGLRWCPCIPLTLYPRAQCWVSFPVYWQALPGDLNQPHGNCYGLQTGFPASILVLLQWGAAKASLLKYESLHAILWLKPLWRLSSTSEKKLMVHEDEYYEHC